MSQASLVLEVTMFHEQVYGQVGVRETWVGQLKALI